MSREPFTCKSNVDLPAPFAPAIATNNRMVLKPSEKTPLTALRVGELMRYTQAYFPTWDEQYAEELREAFDLDKTVYALRTWPMEKAGVEERRFVPVDTPREAVEKALEYAAAGLAKQRPGKPFDSKKD